MSTTGKGGGGLWGMVPAGGPGSRLGGGKHLRRVGGRRLLDIALDLVGQVCPRVMVVTGQVEEMAELPCPILSDRWPGQGPLGALTTAFLDSDADGILMLAVDLPLMRPQVLRLVLEQGRDQVASVAQGPGGLEPLAAYYSRSCLPAALRLVEAGERRPRMLVEVVGAQVVPRQQVLQADPEDVCFVNVNYPDDLDRVRRYWDQRGAPDTPGAS